VSARYETESSTDYVRRLVTVRYTGTVWAANADSARPAINRLLPEGTKWVQDDRRAERVKWFGRLTDDNDDLPKDGPEAGAGFLVKMDFSCAYVQRLEGEDALIEVELSEEYEHSGSRLVARPTAFGRDVVQTCGIQSGRRTIRASATAVLEATAVAWVQQQYNLAFSDAIGAAPATAPPVHQRQLRHPGDAPHRPRRHGQCRRLEGGTGMQRDTTQLRLCAAG